MATSDVIDPKEKLLLEYIMCDREVFIKCYTILKDSYFEKPLDRVVGFVKQYFQDHHGVPSTDIIYAETGVEMKHREIDDTEQSYVLDEIEEFCSKQAMSEAILDSVDLVESGDIHAVQQLVRDALMVKLDTQLGTSLFDDIKERIRRTREERVGYQIGIDAIDQINGGNWYRGEMYMFAGATSTGKSVMLANVVDGLSSQGLDSLIISVEMDEDPYSVRLDSIVSGLGIGSDIDQLSDTVEEKSKTYGTITIKRVNTKFDMEDLRSYLMEYHLQHGKYPDVVALDYIDIMGAGGKLSNLSVFDRDEIKSHTFRDIMIEYDMLGFTACQLNRDSYTDVINVSIAHIQGGISKAQACEAVIAMVATDEDLDNNQLQFKGIKVRNAEKTSMMTTIYRDPKTLRMSDKPFDGSAPKATSPISKKSSEDKVDKGKTKADNTPKKESSKPSKGRDKLRDAMKRMG